MRIYFLTVMLLFSWISCSKKPTPLAIGHRGAKGYVAENTLASVQKALALGVDGIEIDVFVCQTGELVVFHDKTLEKLTDATGYIEALPLDSIRKITVLGSEPIPTLNEILDEVPGKVVLNIELKGAGTAKPTIDLLDTYFQAQKIAPKDILISSFDWNELAIFFANNAEVPIAVLTEDDPLDAIPVAQQLKAVAINPDFKSLTAENVDKIHKQKLKIYPWTVNTEEDIQKMIDLGVDGIISDFPDRIQK